MKLATMTAACLLLTTGVVRAADPAALDLASTKRQDLLLQVSLLRKIKADERFISQGALDAPGSATIKGLYDDAARDLRCPGKDDAPPLQVAEQANFTKTRLLCADIAYRRFLLEKRIGFWGGVRNMEPEIPPLPLQTMQQTLKKMDLLLRETNARVERGEANDALLYGVLNEAKQAEGNRKAQGYLTLNATTRSEAVRARTSQLQGRLGALREQRTTLRAYHAEALDRVASAQASMGAAMVSGITSATGAPPWLVDVARGGSPEKALRTAALGYLQSQLATNADLRNKVAENLSVLKEGARNVGTLYADAVQLKEKVDRYKGHADTLYAAIRQPTVAGVLDLGNAAWEVLPKDQQARWLQGVSTGKPILELATIISAPGSLRDKLSTRAFEYVAKSPQFAKLMDQAIDNTMVYRLQELKDNPAVLYAGWIKNIPLTTLGQDELALVADSYARAATGGFQRQLDTSALTALRANLKLATDDALEAYIASKGILSIPGVRIDAMEVQIRNNVGATLWRQPLAKLLATEVQAAAMTSTAAEKELSRAMKTFAGSGEKLRSAVVELMPPTQVESVLRTVVSPGNVIDPTRAQAAWSQIVGNDDNEKTRVFERLAAHRVGIALGADQLAQEAAVAKAKHEKSAAMVQLPPRSRPPVPNEAEQAAMMAAQAAFPGVATGAMLAKKLFDGMVEMDAATDWMKDINARLEANVITEARILDLHEAAFLDTEVSAREMELHADLQRAYAESFDILAASADAAARQQNKNLAAIALRRTLILYLAEQMRMQFDSFNLALGRWGNYPANSRTQVFQIIGSDPQNLRLALDPEIQLFQQFDRDTIEATKTDIDRLVNHWRKMVTFAETACDTIGCNGQRPAASVTETALLSLCDFLDPPEQERWREWQRLGRDEFFRTTIFLDASKLAVDVGDDSDERSHRIIDMRFAGAPGPNPQAGSGCQGAPGAGALSQVPGMRVTHPGVGYVYRGHGVFDREVLSLRRAAMDTMPDQFNIAALKSRWAKTRPVRGEMEGLPLFTALEISVPPTPATRQLRDIRFRIAYHYIDQRNVVNEDQYLRQYRTPALEPYQYQFELPGGTFNATNSKGGKVSYVLPGQRVLAPGDQLRMVSRMVTTARPDISLFSSPLSAVGAAPLASDGMRLTRSCRPPEEVVEEMRENKARDLARKRQGAAAGTDDLLSSVNHEQAERLVRTQHPLFMQQAGELIGRSGCKDHPLTLIARNTP
jgi:hypothetical protein